MINAHNVFEIFAVKPGLSPVANLLDSFTNKVHMLLTTKGLAYGGPHCHHKLAIHAESV